MLQRPARASVRAVFTVAAMLMCASAWAEITTLDPGLYFAPDSPPGWKPDSQQKEEALATAQAFFDAIDKDDFKRAHALFAPKIQGQTDLKQFSTERALTNQHEGPDRKRVFTRITWSKDPSLGAEPGVYAAIDFTGRFSNVDRYCGYIIVAEPASGGPFQVRRLEENSIDNATAEKLRKDQSQDYLDRTWITVSQRCPNYSPTLAATGPLPEDASVLKNTGFTSVADAIEQLSKKPGVQKENGSADGWMTYSEESSRTVWSFAPAGYYAYPSMVQRQLKVDPGTGAATIVMSIICQADKTSCDRLARESDARNKATAAALNARVK